MKKLMLFRSKSAAAGLAFALCAVASGRAAVIHVPADYTTIQAAVDAAISGDEIQIADGVYTNQVVIENKSLTLSGSPGAVLRATPGMRLHHTLTSMLEIFQSDVVVSGLTFEGDRLADSQPRGFFGLLFVAASGRVEDCRFSGWRGETLHPANASTGIDVENPFEFGYGTANVQVLRNTFADNDVSIRLMGGFESPSTPNLNFAVNDNTIVGAGPDATGNQAGIWIWGGAGGEVKRNIITDHAYTGATEAVPISFGILAEDVVDFNQGAPLTALQPIQFEGNILLNNQVDLALIRGDGSVIVNNSFEGTAPGYRPGGLLFSGENVKVIGNRFYDLPLGILLFGLDEQFSTYLGITSNAKLVANEFCGVVEPIVIEDLVTGTIEQGNQLDACY